MAGKKANYGQYGITFGKPDLDRVGLFAEMSYMNGKKYSPPLKTALDDRSKGKGFIAPSPKWKTELQDCYFDKEFKRIFAKEAYQSPFQAYLREGIKSKAKNVSPKPFYSTVPTKESSTPGDIYGTFDEKPAQAFSPLPRKQPKISEKGYFTTAPPKEGNAGYADIGLNKYPEHKNEYYDAAKLIYKKNLAEYKKKIKYGPFFYKCHRSPYFDENPYKTDSVKPTYREIKDKNVEQKGPKFILPGPGKKLGGDMSGCFDKYPAHANEKYLSPAEIERALKKKLPKATHDSGILRPPGSSKSWRLSSEIPYNMKFRVHAKNWQNACPFVYFRPC